jgi:hypothetical protein
MLKEAELFCEADLPGMQFSIEGVSVLIHFIRVDHEGDESMCPKYLVACSLLDITRGFEFDYDLNVRAGAAAVEATAAAPDAAPDANM